MTRVRTFTVEIATPTAAATATGPSEVSASGVVASPESARFRSPATSSAWLRCAATCLSTPVGPPGVSGVESAGVSSGAPAAEASPAAEIEESPVAERVTSSSASTLRASSAVTVCRPIVNPRASPTAAVPAAADAPAVDSAEASRPATSSSEPVMSSSPPPPSRAVEVTVERVIATEGETAIVALPAPILATVEILAVASATSVTSWAPITATPSRISARVDSSTMVMAKEAPTPTLPVPTAPDSAGIAWTSDPRSECASMRSSPPGESVAVPASSAVVLRSMRAIATEPAIDTPPAAPEVAMAETSEVAGVDASMTMAWASADAPAAIVAVVLVVTRVSATPAPIATLGEPAAEPAPALAASDSTRAATRTVPVRAVMLPPAASVAVTVTVARATPTAAAAPTTSSEVAALGASGEAGEEGALRESA